MVAQIQVARQHAINTTSCQRVVHEDLQPSKGTGTIVIQSDLTHPKLLPVFYQHVMNGRVLCPSGLYADMAMTVADYLYRALVPSAPVIGLNVCAMEVHKPLMAETPRPIDGQHIQMEATASLETGEVQVKFRSVTWDGEILQDHGHGMIRYEDPAVWEAEWLQIKYLVQGQMEMLNRKFDVGEAHKLLRGLTYKIFSILVAYGPKYHGMSEVILDKSSPAAVAKINLQTTPGLDGDFFCSPYNIDNLCHLSGFIVNSSDVESDQPLVYISHGWESLKFLRPTEISPEKEYRSFVRMIPQERNVSAGDVYIFEGDEIIAVLYGLKFQGIQQRLMDVLIPPPPKKTTVTEMQFKGSKEKGEKKKSRRAEVVVAVT